jgi:phosphoribosyl 1,2-cyclic phosphodiesterase
VRAFVLGTGSSGNALLVETAAGARVLVDAGIGPRKLERRLALLGVPDPTELRLDAIVPTHRHGDHFGELERLARASRAPIWVHRGLASDVAPRLRARFTVHEYDPGRAFRVGDLELLAEPVPHDAPHVALRLATKDHALGVATDVGHVTRELVALLARCDAALVESNHCPELLAWGPYPQRLKDRVSGGLGHLSNARAADLAARLVGSRLARLWLGHLSRANNTPERALDVVASKARRIDVSVLPHGAISTLDVPRGRAEQLALPFD